MSRVYGLTRPLELQVDGFQTLERVGALMCWIRDGREWLGEERKSGPWMCDPWWRSTPRSPPSAFPNACGEFLASVFSISRTRPSQACFQMKKPPQRQPSTVSQSWIGLQSAMVAAWAQSEQIPVAAVSMRSLPSQVSGGVAGLGGRVVPSAVHYVAGLVRSGSHTAKHRR
jgi:hypothetical protein